MYLSFMAWSLVGSVLLFAGYFLYWSLLPRPIPGIPHNAASAKRLFGDVPDMLRWQAQTKEALSFLTHQCIKLNSPIVQVFVRPFGKPWVVITDFREAQDIMLNRTAEFDRSQFFGDLFIALMPQDHISLMTGEEWRAHRRLLSDTMSPQFLNDVAAPQIYLSTLHLLDLWDQKRRLAKGRPFPVDKDVHRSALEIIMAATFGSESGTAALNTRSFNDVEVPGDIDSEIIFPTPTISDTFKAILMLSESCEIPLNSPVPRVHHWLALNLMPSLRFATKLKNKLMNDELRRSWRKLCSTPNTSDTVKSALDLVVHREAQMAKKEGREAKYDSDIVKDELLGFLIAGHETTSTTITWGLKLLTANQRVQQILRSVLKAAFPSEKMPTAREIAKSNIPYLDGVIEEINRLGTTISGNMRVSTVDTELLGYKIPKGTDIFLMTNGPSYIAEPLEVDENKRSPSSRNAKDEKSAWEASDIGLFMPERWLKTDEKGNTAFDSKAGPALPFGAGLRACFGKKLAYVELRIVFVLLILKFNFRPTPPALSTFKGKDILTHQPQQCYLRLEEA